MKLHLTTKAGDRLQIAEISPRQIWLEIEARNTATLGVRDAYDLARALTAWADERACIDSSPPWFTGRWQDWHRGHGCEKDDGKPRTDDGQREIDAHAAGTPPRRGGEP